MNAIDTNIWIYTYDESDPVKQREANDLVDSLFPLVLPWQVGCEFISASRRLAPQGFTREDAWNALGRIRKVCGIVAMPSAHVWDECGALHRGASIHFWDAILVACCRHAGVTRLYSEDLPGGLDLPGFEIINPFSA